MVVLDLEFNSGMYSSSRLEEVLQIGAVRVDRPGGPVIASFNAYIKPRVHKRMSPGAKVLPELEESLEGGVAFEDAYRSFLEFCDGETVFAEWGRDDFKILGRNAVYFGMEPMLPEELIDIQAAFMRTVGAVNGSQLYQAAVYCGIPDTFVFHNALNDAMYTSLVGGFASGASVEESRFSLTQEDICPTLRPKKAKKAQTRSGPYESLERALNNMGCRRAVCPECRSIYRVKEWHLWEDGKYYGSARCESHGEILRRLQIHQTSDGKLWAYSETLPATPQNLRRLTPQNLAHSCRRSHSPSYLRRRRERRKKKR